jgi:hypothetical protein
VRLAEGGKRKDDTFYSHLSQVLEGTSSGPTPPTAFCDVLFSSKNAKAGLFDPKRHTDQESIRTGRPGKFPLGNRIQYLSNDKPLLCVLSKQKSHVHVYWIAKIEAVDRFLQRPNAPEFLCESTTVLQQTLKSDVVADDQEYGCHSSEYNTTHCATIASLAHYRIWPVCTETAVYRW